MKRKALWAAVPYTVPVMLGYLFLGAAFGVLIAENGFSVLWAFLMSTFIYAGSMQFAAISLMTSAFSPVSAFLLTLMVNARHLFYGLSMLKPFERMGKRKPYMIFSLTDETYSLLCSMERPKDFSDREIDVIEIMLQKLYTRWGITDESDFECLAAEDYPVLSDLYAFIEEEYQGFDENRRQLYTAEMIQSILLGLNSMCVGAESKFFNGHTNITDDGFITFGVKGLLQASRSLKNALLFNVLSFMSDVLLTQGNTAASLDEFYLFLSNLTAVEYVRNFMKRVRKKDSAVIIASQNLEDFNLDGVREYTKPLFSIPTHQFLFNAGSIDAKFYTDTLQLEDSEYNLIRYPQRGVCLYKCGNERYNLMVNAPEHKARLFGKAGGR